MVLVEIVETVGMVGIPIQSVVVAEVAAHVVGGLVDAVGCGDLLVVEWLIVVVVVVGTAVEVQVVVVKVFVVAAVD